jgi:hypothetical protein
MKTNKMKIRSHTFLGSDDFGYKYEITFNNSLEHTCRMNAMTDGLNRFDKWRGFYLWLFNFVSLFPFTKKLQNKLYQKF